MWPHIASEIAAATGKPFEIRDNQAVTGGDINSASRVRGFDGESEVDYFIKTNHVRHGDMFMAEAEGLREMAASNTVRVPEVVCYGETGNQCFIVMEYLPLTTAGDKALLGRQLAEMHRHTDSRFGWRIDNTIGATPQRNTPETDWVSFWRKHRLGFQLELAKQNGYGGELQRLGEKLMADFPALFDSYQPQASMLHGDLWGGNAGGLFDGTPVIFDPAFYYGDREAEMAMTHLFGGFSADFYSAYNEAWPLDDGFATRMTFYNIYHIINHANLFGGGYASQATSMIRQVLAEL